jgi:hypothetical protein
VFLLIPAESLDCNKANFEISQRKDCGSWFSSAGCFFVKLKTKHIQRPAVRSRECQQSNPEQEHKSRLEFWKELVLEQRTNQGPYVRY